MEKKCSAQRNLLQEMRDAKMMDVLQRLNIFLNTEHTVQSCNFIEIVTKPTRNFNSTSKSIRDRGCAHHHLETNQADSLGLALAEETINAECYYVRLNRCECCHFVVFAISPCIKTTQDCMLPNWQKKLIESKLGVAGSSAVQPQLAAF
ncbi:hypothetical protein KIN20_000885 [Parelaphostrongylus tenuis]|uniref:Uncharacterized protein n=1 Tax=Parelaphostrongylus tenuis TaxID=148309 RepID=A0AAD5QBV5_PARTN|nr:hypothetical protein KIN20_000885 [Parelaphostrongylus tenuis]